MAFINHRTKSERFELTRKVVITVLILFLLESFMLIIVSAWMSSQQIQCSHTQIYYSSCYLGIIVGVGTLSATVLGFNKVQNRRSSELIILLSLCSFAMVILHIAITVVAFTQYQSVTIGELNYVLSRNMESYESDESSQRCWDSLQEGFSCCGLQDYSDWANISLPEDKVLRIVENSSNISYSYQVPQSCQCSPNDQDGVCSPTNVTGESIFTEPCYSSYSQMILYNLEVMRLLSPVILGVQIIQFFLMTCMVLKINNFRTVEQIYEVHEQDSQSRQSTPDVQASRQTSSESRIS